MKFVLPHELFDLTDEEAADCLCILAKIIIEKGKEEREKVDSPEKCIDLLPHKCSKFGAYMIGFFTGLHAQFADNTAIEFVKMMMNEVKNNRTELLESFIKYNELDERFNLNIDELIDVVKRISEIDKVIHKYTIEQFDEKYQKFVSFFLGYLDGLAAQYFDNTRVYKEVTFLGELYLLCDKEKDRVIAKLSRLKSEAFEEKIKDVQ